jgi:hypothetical protein
MPLKSTGLAPPNEYRGFTETELLDFAGEALEIATPESVRLAERLMDEVERRGAIVGRRRRGAWRLFRDWWPSL